MNMLDHGCDNFGYAMAFGSVTSHCFQLFTGASFAEGPTWSKSKNNTLAGHTLQKPNNTDALFYTTNGNIMSF